MNALYQLRWTRINEVLNELYDKNFDDLDTFADPLTPLRIKNVFYIVITAEAAVYNYTIN